MSFRITNKLENHQPLEDQIITASIKERCFSSWIKKARVFDSFSSFFELLSLTSSSAWHDSYILGSKRFTVFSYKIRIIYFTFIKVFSSIKFSFLSWIIVRYWTDISHHSSVYLTWSSCLDHFVLYFDLKFFLGCIHNDTDFQIDTVYMILDRVSIYIYLFLFSTRSILLFSFHIICS